MILQLHEKLIAKKISAEELARHYLDRSKKDGTNSYITLCEEEALTAAKAADHCLRDPSQITPLTGIPLAIKDAICVEGVRLTCGSKILGNYKPPYDATVIERLKNQNAVVLGKLNMDEFAMGGSNENSSFGPVKNPVHEAYVPGGSSGGSAAAVKAGLAVATLGSDTGGSVRLPACYTGTVGLRPTYGTVSRYGLVAFASSLDQIGPMGVSTEDVALLLSALSGYDQKDATSAQRPTVSFLDEIKKLKNKKFKIGLPKEYFIDGIQPNVRKAIDEAIECLKKEGHTFYEVSLPHTDYAVSVYYIVAVSEASSNLARFDGVRFGERRGSDQSLIEMYKQTRALFGEEVKRRIVLGTFALSSGYYDAYYKKACQVRRLVKQDFDQSFSKVDLIMAPVSPTTAFKIGEKASDPLKMYLNDIFTIPSSLAGLPGVSVPVGRDSKSLPIGVQFIGKPFADAEVLTMAQAIEDHFYREDVNHGF